MGLNDPPRPARLLSAQDPHLPPFLHFSHCYSPSISPPSRALLPSCPARSSSPHWAFLIARLLLSVVPLHPPELLLATSPPVCLRCSVMPAPGLFFPLFLAVLYNFNGTVTVSLNQYEIQFAQQKP